VSVPLDLRRTKILGKVCWPIIVAVSLLSCSPREADLVDANPSSSAGSSKVSCGVSAYVNDAGVCVSEPVLSVDVPPGATAKCKAQVGGKHWYSFSQTRRGTCSRFGGVLQWCELGVCRER